MLVADEHAIVVMLAAVGHPWLTEGQHLGPNSIKNCFASLWWWQEQMCNAKHQLAAVNDLLIFKNSQQALDLLLQIFKNSQQALDVLQGLGFGCFTGACQKRSYSGLTKPSTSNGSAKI